MTKNDSLAKLCNILVDLYDDQSRIRSLVEQANLRNPGGIDFKQPPLDVWKVVLREADKQNCVFDIVVIALNQYSAKKEELTQIYKTYEVLRQNLGKEERLTQAYNAYEQVQSKPFSEPFANPSLSNNKKDSPNGRVAPRWAYGVIFVLLAIIGIMVTVNLGINPKEWGLPLQASPTPIQAVVCASVTEIPSDECAALVALYNSTNGPNWITQNNWLETNTPCSSPWYGVECQNSHVTKLNLPQNGLNGELPEELGNLTEITWVNLASDSSKPDVKLRGPWPETLRAWTKLQEIDLTWNSIQIDLTNGLGDLPNLTALGLAYNPVTGKIPSALLKPSLVSLDLNFTAISDTIPTNLEQLVNLETLSLGSDNLSGEIPAILGQLPKLKSLTLVTNNQKLTGSLNWVLQKKDWINLQIEGRHGLSGEIPSEIGQLTELQRLILVGNGLTGTIPSSIGQLQHLRQLALGGANLHGSIPPEVGNLPHLSYLEITNSGVSGVIPPEIGNLVNLEVLKLVNNQLTGLIPVALTNLPKLESLVLDRNKLNATDPTLLEFLRQKKSDWAQTQRYDLIGHWQFDECEGNMVNDVSGLVNHGQLANGAVMVPVGRGCTLQFAQNGESMAITYTPSLEPMIGTIELWLKPDKLPETATDILWKESFNPTANSNFAAYGLRIGADGAVHAYIVGINSGNPSSSPGIITVGSWHHLAIRWNGIDLALYVNGILQGTSPYTPNPLMGVSDRTLNTLHVGSITCCFNDQAGIWYEYFIGQIDDLRFYARSLSNEEIQQLHADSAITPTLVATQILEATPTPTVNICATVKEIVPLECEALVALYNSTDGPNWITKTNWLEPDTSPCSWYGVTCKGGVINQLSLENNRLSGTIPLEIGNLLHLDLLSLAANQLTGEIPKALEDLPNLTKLYLYQNQLNGTIPAELSHLTQLRELRLDNNNLSGEIPRQLGNISGLVELNLSSNHLTGNIPVELRNLRHLTRLVLNQNQLNGPIPSELSDLEALKIIWLYSNQLTGKIPDIWREFTQLECLRLNSNQFTGTIPSSFGQLTNLKGERECLFGGDGLDLGDNVLNATDPALLDFLAQKDPDWAQTQRYELIGHWQFDECAGNVVNDTSDVENHGNLQGAVTFTVDAVSGCTLQFSTEGGQVVVAHSPSLEPITGTIEAWVNVDHLPISETLPMEPIGKATDLLVRRNIPGGFTVYALRILNTGAVAGLVANDDVSTSNVMTWTGAVSPPSLIVPGTWHHIALRWDKTTIAVFVDGQLREQVGSNPISYSPVPTTGLSYHGITQLLMSYPSPNVESFAGKLDEVRFYARALSDEEIQENYQLYVGTFTTPTATVTATLESTPTTTASLTNTANDGSSSFCTTVNEISPTECEALVALYNSTDGPNWITKTNWLETNTPCSNPWYGISCENGNVTAITLVRNNLQGTLPETMKAFKRLKILNLWLNQIRGDLPEWLGGLLELEQLNLYGSPVTGEIPETLLKLKLTGLDLNSTQISGSIPVGLGEMTTLTDLRLGSDFLTGEIPDLHKLDKLEMLIIGGSSEYRLTGSLTWLQNLTRLTWLAIGRHNGLEASEVITAVAPLSNTLKVLALANNQLRGPIPESLNQLTNLECLDLSNNQLTGFIPVSLTKLNALHDKFNPDDPTKSERCANAIPGGGDGLNLSGNALVAVDSDFRDFLNRKESDWETTQRILSREKLQNPPANIPAGQVWFNPVDEAPYVYVPADEFVMGGTQDQINKISEVCKQQWSEAAICNLTPTSPLSLTINGFWIMQTEVTNAQYQHFIDAGGYTRQDLWTAAGWQWRTENAITEPNNNEEAPWNGGNYPIVGVSWYESVAYTNWLARESGLEVRLPTAAEWEKAARGTDEHFIYPWGAEWDGSRVNYCTDFDHENACNNNGQYTEMVGNYPQGASPYGALDMAGNAQEWTSTLLGMDPNQPNQNMEAGDSDLRVVGGNGFNSMAGLVSPILTRAGCQGPGPNCPDENGQPSFRHRDVGFRVVIASSANQ